MSKGRVGEDRGSKEMDGCPHTPAAVIVKMEVIASTLQDTLHVRGTPLDLSSFRFLLSFSLSLVCSLFSSPLFLHLYW
jgi:hypothetical protein